MTVRLPGEMAAELGAVARTDEGSVSQTTREAIKRHIAPDEQIRSSKSA